MKLWCEASAPQPDTSGCAQVGARPTGVPYSAFFRTKVICASEDFVLFIAYFVSWPSDHNWNFPAQNGPEFGMQVTMHLRSLVQIPGLLNRSIANLMVFSRVIAARSLSGKSLSECGEEAL
ncbi:hypothetical protein KRR38_32810 [Novosphingobium sp. G106]|uniref:hypothetical protein n=1 Tax=Novosphingobium sp. G106 TaxID=2849500 RepID=UPI001C2D74F2|nr:hypothetical protein [Novosphingobium sp. G106]MBV1692313.1 hypothetical protein [Novosphingobium sp. G106]